MTSKEKTIHYVNFCHELYRSPIYSKGDLFSNIQYFTERKLCLEYFASCDLGMQGRDIILAIRKSDSDELDKKQFAVKFIKSFSALCEKKKKKSR